MEIRLLKQEEYAIVQKFIQDKVSWAAMPPMESLFGKFENGKLVGVLGVQRPAVVDYLVAESGADAHDLSLWIDGLLAGTPYYFFITNPIFQKTVEKHYGENVEWFQGKLYKRRR